MRPLFSREEESAWRALTQDKEGYSFFHLYTKPTEKGILISDRTDLNIAKTYMALAAADTGVVILVYAVMSNHFHWIVRGTATAITRFFERFRYLMDVYLSRHDKGKQIRNVTSGLTAITSLKQFRDEAAYVLRNPFVVRSDINILINEWTSGFLYYNPYLNDLVTTPAKELTKKDKRILLKSSILNIPEGLSILGDSVNPASFVDFKTVETLFWNARKFTTWLLRNVEAQIETALKYSESPNLPDEELGPIVWRFCLDRFGQKNFRNLLPAQKLEAFKEFKFKYSSSNSQLARITGIPIREIDSLFPVLSSPK